jgi:hypothetical protein
MQLVSRIEPLPNAAASVMSRRGVGTLHFSSSPAMAVIE